MTKRQKTQIEKMLKAIAAIDPESRITWRYNKDSITWYMEWDPHVSSSALQAAFWGYQAALGKKIVELDFGAEGGTVILKK